MNINKRSKVSAKGQVTIPKEARSRLCLQPGDDVVWVEDRDGVRLRKHVPEAVFDKWRGYLKDLAGRSSDEIVDEMRGRWPLP